jgi:hypothetical protein
MRQVLSVAAVVLAAFSALPAAVQDKPNFAGTWKLTSEAGGDPFTSPQLVVTQDAKLLTVTTSSQMGEIKTVYNVDGSEASSPLDFGGGSIDRTTRMSWEGTKLVMTTKADFGGMPFETKAVWTLDAGGTLMVETTRPDFMGGGGPVTTKGSYKK